MHHYIYVPTRVFLFATKNKQRYIVVCQYKVLTFLGIRGGESAKSRRPKYDDTKVKDGGAELYENAN